MPGCRFLCGVPLRTRCPRSALTAWPKRPILDVVLQGLGRQSILRLEIAVGDKPCPSARVLKLCPPLAGEGHLPLPHRSEDQPQ